MRLPTNPVNRCLAVLLGGSGYASLSQFAIAVNEHGYRSRGLDTRYDRSSVRRWVDGMVCEHPDVVAEVLSHAWGIPIPSGVVWPHTRNGVGPFRAHVHPWVVDHTLAELGALLCRDALASRSDLTAALPPADGAVLVSVIRRWLAAEPGRLHTPTTAGGLTSAAVVEYIERATTDHAVDAATAGGGLCRDAAVGQLRHAVEQLRHGHLDPVVGNRLLAVVADLAGVVSVMTGEAQMPGPAQAYVLLGLHAARESTHPRAGLLVVAMLVHLADQLHTAGDPVSGLGMLDLATTALPDRWRHHQVQARLHSHRAVLLAATAPGRVDEITNAVTMAGTLTAHAHAAGEPAWPQNVLLTAGDGDLCQAEADTYLTLATHRPDGVGELAARAAAAAAAALHRWPAGYRRRHAIAQLDLATARFLLGEPDAANRAVKQARKLLDTPIAADLTRPTARLVAASEPWQHLDTVQHLRRWLQNTATPAPVLS